MTDVILTPPDAVQLLKIAYRVVPTTIDQGIESPTIVSLRYDGGGP